MSWFISNQFVSLAILSNEHIERVSQHELNQQKRLKERRETFEEAFKEDLEEYKATGSIPSIILFLNLIQKGDAHTCM